LKLFKKFKSIFSIKEYVINFYDKDNYLIAQVFYQCKKCDEEKIIRYALKRIKKVKSFCFFDIEKIKG